MSSEETNPAKTPIEEKQTESNTSAQEEMASSAEAKPAQANSAPPVTNNSLRDNITEPVETKSDPPKCEEKPNIDTEGEAGQELSGGYMIPQREILLPDEISSVWETSQAYADLLGFIMAMSDAVKGKKLRDEYQISPVIEKLTQVLEAFDKLIAENPPTDDQPQRFGNKAYRDWFARMAESCEPLLKDALDEKFHLAIPEISVYLRESAGNSTRIDYGTGHEMAFVAFLCCLYKVGALQESDAVATVFTLFHRYVLLMRRLQQTYRMEPAGSQGVWNLDDFSFVPFIWGSAQLIEHIRLKPKHYPEAEMCDTFAKDYLFFEAVQYIHKVKTGPFHEHSNQLWNISGVKLWAKVHSGLIKMYKAEVLSKFPVIQHFLFGSLMSVEPADQSPPS